VVGGILFLAAFQTWEEHCMEVKLYVGNLPFDANEDFIRSIFAESGTVVSVALVKDHRTGTSRGFGFVEMGSQPDADAAIKALNGKMVADRTLSVSVARSREERTGLPRRDDFRRHAGRGKGKRY
jgi:cold-inducible RNA-binding protein